MRMLRQFILFSLMATLLSACPPPRGEDLPVGETQQGTNNAVQALMVDARAAFETGRYALAATYLERAARIEPNNPYVWSFMAEVRLAQRQYAQALQLLTLSDSLAPAHDRALKEKNQRIRAQAEAAQAMQP